MHVRLKLFFHLHGRNLKTINSPTPPSQTTSPNHPSRLPTLQTATTPPTPRPSMRRGWVGGSVGPQTNPPNQPFEATSNLLSSLLPSRSDLVGVWARATCFLCCPKAFPLAGWMEWELEGEGRTVKRVHEMQCDRHTHDSNLHSTPPGCSNPPSRKTSCACNLALHKLPADLSPHRNHGKNVAKTSRHISHRILDTRNCSCHLRGHCSARLGECQPLQLPHALPATKQQTPSCANSPALMEHT